MSPPHAGLAADTALVIEVDDAVGSAKQRDSRANFDARRIVAMIAAQHREVTPGVGITALFNIFDPGAIYAERNVVFFLAGHRARMASWQARWIVAGKIALLLTPKLHLTVCSTSFAGPPILERWPNH